MVRGGVGWGVEKFQQRRVLLDAAVVSSEENLLLMMPPIMCVSWVKNMDLCIHIHPWLKTHRFRGRGGGGVGVGVGGL